MGQDLILINLNIHNTEVIGMEQILNDYIRDDDGNPIEKTKEFKYGKYNVKIVKKYIYNPERVQQGYDILCDAILNQYFKEVTK